MTLSARCTAEIEIRHRARDAAQADEGLMDFITRVSPDFIRPDHMAPLVEAFERSETEEVFAVIHAPPRHAKTETGLHAIAWRLQRNPKLRVGYASYAARLAKNKSRRARELTARAGVKLDPMKKAAGEWATFGGGGVFSAGRGGPFTGEGFDLIVLDDPLKNRAEAESSTIREGLHEWFTSTVLTRLEPGGSVFIPQTRWHSDDLPGRLLKSGGFEWESIKLSAINDAGEALWPERWPLELLEKRRSLVSEMDWHSLFQGNPRPRGSAVYGQPTFYQKLPTGIRYGAGLDFAYTAKTSSDWNVIVEGVADANNVYVTNSTRMQARSHVWKDTLKIRRSAHRHAIWVAYCSGVEKGVVDLLNHNSKLKIRAENANTDKFIRAQPSAALWNSGRLMVPDPDHIDAPWLSDFLSEVMSFTGLGDKTDDQIDGLAGLVKALSRTGSRKISMRGESFEVENPFDL